MCSSKQELVHEAIKESLKLWIRLSEGKDYEDRLKESNTHLCPLCDLVHGFCKKCIVLEYTDKILCRNTPYNAWIQHYYASHGQNGLWRSEGVPYKVQPGCKVCVNLAKEIVSFIQEMLAWYEALAQYEQKYLGGINDQSSQRLIKTS